MVNFSLQNRFLTQVAMPYAGQKFIANTDMSNYCCKNETDKKSKTSITGIPVIQNQVRLTICCGYHCLSSLFCICRWHSCEKQQGYSIGTRPLPILFMS